MLALAALYSGETKRERKMTGGNLTAGNRGVIMFAREPSQSPACSNSCMSCSSASHVAEYLFKVVFERFEARIGN